jgi:hypothetical protein
MKPKALVAELVGTFGLTLAVLISINNPDFPVSTPVIAGVTLGLFVYTIGGISGCHINPAVTLGLASIGKIELPSALGYLVAQFVGAGICRSSPWGTASESGWPSCLAPRSSCSGSRQSCSVRCPPRPAGW